MPVFRRQLLVGAVLDDAPAIDDVDPVRVADGGQAVRDDEPRRAQPLQAAADDLLRAVVQRARRFVEEQDCLLYTSPSPRD